jgi:hypothetical protein
MYKWMKGAPAPARASSQQWIGQATTPPRKEVWKKQRTKEVSQWVGVVIYR